jgi:glycosyltransferase involved in cell wall biosynthesis
MKMAQALAHLGHEIRVAAPGEMTLLSWEEISQFYGLRTSFPIAWLPARPGLRRYDYGGRAVSWARQWKAELLYTRLPQAAAISSTLKMPTIYEIHDLPQGSANPWLFRRFMSGSGARRLVVITRTLAEALARLLKVPLEAPFTVIAPDGVDLERFDHLPEPAEARRNLNKQLIEGKPLPERFTAGYTGHLYAGRGKELLLDLAERLPEVNFLLVGGEAEEAERMRQEAARKGVGNFFVTGFVDNAALPQYQAACEVLLMPYQAHVAASSGGDIAPFLSPMKLFEYLACGRAILSSNLPVLREALTESNAVLLPPADLNAWVAALERLQVDPQLRARLGEQARRDAPQYSWERRAQRILDFSV